MERQLAITTRTVEYLYCGIVPIYSQDLELSELIKKLEIGICLTDPTELLDITNLKDRVKVCRQNIFEKFPACWQLDKCLEDLQELITSVSGEVIIANHYLLIWSKTIDNYGEKLVR